MPGAEDPALGIKTFRPERDSRVSIGISIPGAAGLTPETDTGATMIGKVIKRCFNLATGLTLFRPSFKRGGLIQFKSDGVLQGVVNE
jgi:hypothetical protein